MDKLDVKIDSVNASLKKSLNKLRAPNKLCIDITLFFILAVLIGVLVWVVKFYMNIDSSFD